MMLHINQKAYYDLSEVVTCPLLFDHACHLVLVRLKLQALVYDFQESAGKLCSVESAALELVL